MSGPPARLVRSVRAVLLDALGTLVALDPPAPRLRSELARWGIAVSEVAAETALRAEIAYYLEHHLEGRDERMLSDLRDRCSEVVRESLGATELDRATARAVLLASLRFRAQPDARDALSALRTAGLRCVVASNWDCSLPQVLASVGLAPLLDAVVPSATVGAAKPDPRVIRAALEAAGARPEQAVHVGDSAAHDLVAAAAAGVPAVLLDRRGEARAGLESGRSATAPVAVIGSLAELPALVLGQA